MRKLLIPTAVLAATVGTAAFADATMGTITDINQATGQVMLANGDTVTFADPAAFDNFKVGDAVTIDYAVQGTGPLAWKGNTISPLDTGALVSGTIASITEATGLVTLDNGMSYDFSSDMGAYSNFKVGDMVTIAYADQGSGELSLKGTAISPAVMGSAASGTIASITEATGLVTLDNGATYDFSSNMDAYSNFKVGDMVTIVYADQGSGDLSLKGVSIAPEA